jgi:hypothetical protein
MLSNDEFLKIRSRQDTCSDIAVPKNRKKEEKKKKKRTPSGHNAMQKCPSVMSRHVASSTLRFDVPTKRKMPPLLLLLLFDESRIDFDAT